MSGFKPYPAYKDSGVEWLGEVPDHWVLTQIKYFALLNPKKSDFTGDTKQLCSFVPMEKLKTGVVQLDEERLIEEVIGGYTYFEDGDVLQAKVTPCFENKNVAIAQGLTNGIGLGSSEINVLRPYKGVSAEYLYYRVQEDSYMSFCTSSMIGAGGLKRVPTDVINNFKIAAPNLGEQTQIARFLDHETARIDALIEEQQRLIELLKEKRQAVISHAVTKGLDPTVPMKDSGVEWLGEVPAHWEVKRLRYLLKANGLIRGPFGGDLKKEIFVESGIKVYEQKNAIYRDFSLGDSFITQNKFSEMRRFEVKAGDYIMSCSGTIGRVYRIPEGAPVGIINQALLVIRFSEELGFEFADWIFVANFFVNQIIDNSQGGAMKNLVGMDVFTSISMPVPPVQEQLSIAKYLRDEISRFDSLISAAGQAVNLMQERRSALISAAVTGKIDIRNWRPPAEQYPVGDAQNHSEMEAV